MLVLIFAAQTSFLIGLLVVFLVGLFLTMLIPPVDIGAHLSELPKFRDHVKLHHKLQSPSFFDLNHRVSTRPRAVSK